MNNTAAVADIEVSKNHQRPLMNTHKTNKNVTLRINGTFKNPVVIS